MANRIGAAIALIPATGEVLALVSSPWLDGNSLAENWSDYVADVRSPFLNRVIQGLYPPGSVIKPIVYGGAALEKRLVEPGGQIWLDTGSFQIGGRSIRNFAGQALGSISTEEALALSSNAVLLNLPWA